METTPSLKTYSSVEMFFKMFVVTLRVCLEMLEVKPHEQLMNEGLLVEFSRRSKGEAIFVSHQWTSLGHPDRSGDQFRVLQEALKQGVHGKQRCIPAELLNLKVPRHAKSQDELFIWYDFFSCPQDPAYASSLNLAINSIPAYIERCKYFVILSPFVRHENGKLLGKHSWSDRAWCRMERLSRALSKHEDAGVMIEVQSPQHQILAATFDWVKYPVGEGAFSVASDRAKVGQAVRALLREKMNYYLNTGDLHNFRVMMSLQVVLLRGLNEELVDDLMIIEEGLDVVTKFMRQNGLSTLERQPSGWTPMCYAALSGDTELVSALLQGRADVNDKITKHDRIMQFAPNTTILDICCFLKHNECLKLLLEAHADCSRKDGYGAMASHWAAVGPNPAGLRILKDQQARTLMSPNILGLAPIDMAAAGGHAESILELLDCGELNLNLALHVSILHGAPSPEAVATLIEAKADIDHQLSFSSLSPLGLFFRFLKLRHYWKSSMLSTYAYHHSKATPLMLSICSQSYVATAMLVAAGARLELTNSHGCTAADLAERTLAPEWVLRAVKGEPHFVRACEDMVEEQGAKLWFRI
ncbi:unnamed protein product [Durusdinium trenchii]|uniref:Uncharacterized protein n=1 Tax=Durusdinium trenchii TaxID=1381693 RepID=A0ABP0Q6I9_9DINO